MLASLRILVLSMMWSLPLIAFALYFVLGTQDGALHLAPVLAVAVIAGGLLAHVAILAVGYRTRPVRIDASAEAAMTDAGQQFVSTAMLRMAMSQGLAFLCVAGAFLVSEGGFALYCLGALVSLGLLGVHAWPNDRVIARIEASLDREGGQSLLREKLGV